MSAKMKRPHNKNPPPKLASSTESNTKTASGLDQEAEDQFELELCWCIQQLEAGLSDKKLQDKQIFNMSKSLSVLKSSNASLIKKRQVMRNTFGDYRAKMAEEEKKFAKAASAVKFGAASNKVDKKSVFFKKAGPSKLTGETKTDDSKCINEEFSQKVTLTTDVPNEPFKFNFSGS